MKKIILILAVILVVLLSCSPQDDTAPAETTPAPEVQDTSADTDTVSESAEVIEELPELPLGGCTPHWGCISSDIKAYQQEDCSWVERKECPLGCVEGACKAGNTCTPGFRCKDSSTKAYQTETCRWNNEQECEWGCEDGKCNLPPGNGTINQTAEPEKVEVKEEAAPPKDVRKINADETQTLEFSGVDHELRIYLIEDGRVRLEIDQQKSDWLGEGTTFAHSSGLSIKVESIFFQPYPGGMKAVEYTIG